MKIKLQVTLDVRLDDWAAEYGLNDGNGRPNFAAAATDARKRISAAARSGDLDGMISAAWPALGDMSTVAVDVAH